MGMRIAYFLVGLLVTLTGALANAMFTVNLPQVQGMLGLTPVEGAWLTGAYVMVNASANLILFKARQQYGVRRFAEIAIIANLAMISLYLVADSYGMALLTRILSGFAAAPMSSLGIMYLLQAFPKSQMGKGLCIALGILQLATPLAYIISPSLLRDGGWQILYRFEFGLALCCLAGIFALKLPPSIRIKVIEPLDFLTFVCLAPAIGLIGAVLAQGRIQWWTEQPWMGYALVVALALLLTGLYIEHYRERPLIQTRWLGSMEVIRFVLGALTMRLILSEQTYAAMGLLRTLGTGPDQLIELNVVIFFGTVVGMLIGALTFSPKTIMLQILASIILIIAASFIDYGSSTLTRAHNMMLSQFLVAIAGAMFLAPILLIAAMKALARGAEYIITLVVLFGLTQAIGGLGGSAVFGTYQQFRQHEYSASINSNAAPTDPTVANRLQLYGQSQARVATDPLLNQATGIALLGQEASREANVRAYNDVFVLNAIIAIAYLLWSIVDIFFQIRKSKTAAKPSAASAGTI
ncbi:MULTISPECIES: MFS transporter [unclassified Pannonibacter]|uniref:MFS transporter n=1 Tax=unclassified Pannonibacter TaxID=2627228 RepID=UPI001FCC99F8|nr:MULTISPECIES: MFS transporter [unclassified Pannonibacter]